MAHAQDIIAQVWGPLTLDAHRGCAPALERLGITLPHPRDLAAQPRLCRTTLVGVEWGDYPGGLPYVLASYGLNLAWITPPAGFESRGSVLTHTGLGIFIKMRARPQAMGPEDIATSPLFGDIFPTRQEGWEMRGTTALLALLDHMPLWSATPSAHTRLAQAAGQMPYTLAYEATTLTGIEGALERVHAHEKAA